MAGLTPREVARTVKTLPRIGHAGLRLLVNEAAVILPGYYGRPISPHRNRVFAFRIRKPYASVMEIGLEQYLTDRSTAVPATWRFLRGLSWFCFCYPTWGRFTVAICSDILDTFAWNWLRGRIQHLFVLAWNTDTDRFDKMTWTRAYELFANVALVNHGQQGGSLAWTPQHGPGRELLLLHGPHQSLAATVLLPVRDLVNHQKEGLCQAVQERAREWQGSVEGLARPDGARPKFKSPPPAFGYDDSGVCS